MIKKANDATKAARASQTPDDHRTAMKLHRIAASASEDPTMSDHHTKMAETHRKRCRELSLAAAHASVEHHTKMAETHERAADSKRSTED